MKTKYPSVLGVFAAILMVASFAIPAITSPPATSASPDIMKWDSIVNAEQVINDDIGPPSASFNADLNSGTFAIKNIYDHSPYMISAIRNTASAATIVNSLTLNRENNGRSLFFGFMQAALVSTRAFFAVALPASSIVLTASNSPQATNLIFKTYSAIGDISVFSSQIASALNTKTPKLALVRNSSLVSIISPSNGVTAASFVHVRSAMSMMPATGGGTGYAFASSVRHVTPDTQAGIFGNMLNSEVIIALV